MSDEEMITIKKGEYDQLDNNRLLLECFMSSGVDSWEGYEDAIERFKELTEK